MPRNPEHFQNDHGRTSGRASRRPVVESLEGRRLMAVNVVGVQPVAVLGGGTNLVVSFNADITTVSAEFPGNYSLLGLGRDDRFNTRDDHVVPIASAVYDEASRSVSIQPGATLSRDEAYLFRVVGTPPTGLTSTGGERLDGASAGVPGTDYVTVLPRGSVPRPLRRGGVTTGEPEFGPSPIRIVTVVPEQEARPYVPFRAPRRMPLARPPYLRLAVLND